MKEKPKYDERQIASQRKAFQWAFYVLVVYLVVFVLVDAFGVVWCETAFGIFFGITLSLVVFSAFCIFHDAFFNIRDSKSSYVIMINCLGVSWLSLGLKDGVPFEDGCITNQGIFLLQFLWIVAVDVCLLMKRKMDCGEAQPDAETD